MRRDGRKALAQRMLSSSSEYKKKKTHAILFIAGGRGQEGKQRIRGSIIGIDSSNYTHVENEQYK